MQWIVDVGMYGRVNRCICRDIKAEGDNEKVEDKGFILLTIINRDVRP